MLHDMQRPNSLAVTGRAIIHLGSKGVRWTIKPAPERPRQSTDTEPKPKEA